MKLPNSEYQVTVLKPEKDKPNPFEQAWWSRIELPCEVTVTDVYNADRQGNVWLDPSEYRIIEGIHEGKHVDSACCSKPVRKEEVA